IPLGGLFLSLFLLLFLFAIFTSAFSLYVIFVAAFTASDRYSRVSVFVALGIILFIVAVPAPLSDSTFDDGILLYNIIFDATDYLVSNIMLSFGSLCIVIFIIHRVNKDFVKEQYTIGGKANLYPIWRFLMTWVVPAVIIIVYLNTLGIVG